jgi:hypothetical protein
MFLLGRVHFPSHFLLSIIYTSCSRLNQHAHRFAADAISRILVFAMAASDRGIRYRSQILCLFLFGFALFISFVAACDYDVRQDTHPSLFAMDSHALLPTGCIIGDGWLPSHCWHAFARKARRWTVGQTYEMVCVGQIYR